MREPFDTPILYLIFNRPELVKKTFSQIKAQRPKQLFIGADGPREANESDVIECKECREWVLSQIDWDCKVQTLFRNENLGCGLAVSGAITWFFEHVEMGIILEDDCLAGDAFFDFCSFSLLAYQEEEQVFHITGTNPVISEKLNRDLTFSKYVNVWGWGTWREAWQSFNFSQTRLLNDKFLLYSFNREEEKYWNSISAQLENGVVDSWAYRWQFSVWASGGLSICPRKNLISNIGFGMASTHTKSEIHPLNSLQIDHTWKFDSKKHDVQQNLSYDKAVFKTVYFHRTSFKNRMRNIGYMIIPKGIYYWIKGTINQILRS
ncbi:MAG: nucleotide-diphospho-sugar transferase [Cyclobacteriaceae bacterium]